VFEVAHGAAICNELRAMQKIILILLMALGLAACRNQTELSEREETKVRDEVKAMLYKYNDAVREQGLQAEFAYIDNSDRFFWVPPGATAPLPFDTVLAMISRNAGQMRLVNNSFDMLTVTPLTSMLAAYSARIRSATTDVQGRDTVLSLVETGMVIKRKEGWKLLCGQTGICNTEP
jgi:hypothetical protein